VNILGAPNSANPKDKRRLNSNISRFNPKSLMTRVYENTSNQSVET
jgi:hypothetical protein